MNNYPKTSIGNYKGVMLCNRPNEFGLQRRPEQTGPSPFNSRVDSKKQNPVGWNPCPKVFPKSRKKGNGFGDVLNRHKQYLKDLEHKKQQEREDIIENQKIQEANVIRFKEVAEKQRRKIQEMKANQELYAEKPADELPEVEEGEKRLSEMNLSELERQVEKQEKSLPPDVEDLKSQHTEKSKAPSKISMKSSKNSKR